MMPAAESEPAAAPALQQAQRRRPFSDEAFVKRIAECKLEAREDVLVILRDAGINFYLDESDEMLKRELSELEVTLLCIHGNHEERPSEIPSYEEVGWNGALVYAEPEFPNLLFAKESGRPDCHGYRRGVQHRQILPTGQPTALVRERTAR